jgi:PhzF family phenazine biosynthesis protein
MPNAAKIPYYQVASFSSGPFSGNPAGVCILDRWIPTELMQAIAAEIALPATAFVVRESSDYGIRWFTPAVEEDMCGHGTLAAAWVIFNRIETDREKIEFRTCGSPLTVVRADDHYVMDLPARPPVPTAAPANLSAALGATPAEVLKAAYYIAVMEAGKTVAALAPDLNVVAKLDLPGLIVTATGEDFGCDIVSRYFAPAKGIPEDPATGSAHCQVVPYWSKRLQRRTIKARQLSKRGGVMTCEDLGSHIRISAAANLFQEGTIVIPH